MWNSKKPLQLLMSMPGTLDKDNLIKLQKVIDVDKLKNSRELGRDLCGIYAPFCEQCNKKVPYPCAQAYVNMKQAEGYDVKVEQSLTEEEPEKIESVIIPPTASVQPQISEELKSEEPVVPVETVEVVEREPETATEIITDVEAPQTADTEEVEEAEIINEAPKRIRIAYLKRK